MPLLITIDYLSALYYLWSQELVNFGFGIDSFDNFIFKDGYFKVSDIFLNKFQLGKKNETQKYETGKMMVRNLNSVVSLIEAIMADQVLPNNDPSKKGSDSSKAKVIMKYPIFKRLY